MKPQFWNRETSSPNRFSSTETTPVVTNARIIALADPSDSANEALYHGNLPKGAELLAVGTTLADIDMDLAKQANVVFVSGANSREPLALLLEASTSIEWIHTRSAGIDFVSSPSLADFQGRVSNAKGMFSSTLAEYSMLACSYFAKDLPRLLANKKTKNWDKYDVQELRGSTFGVVGFGDIGRAAAKLASAYGMKVIAVRRNPEPDPLCEAVYGIDGLNRLFAESDYVFCAAPLTAETKGMIGKEQFGQAKSGCVFINVGRGPIVDEEALVDALKSGKLKGAGLDVFVTEPLPGNSPLWELDNVLLSPHNMDKTATFMKESTDFFLKEALPRFIHGQELLNLVDTKAGY